MEVEGFALDDGRDGVKSGPPESKVLPANSLLKIIQLVDSHAET